MAKTLQEKSAIYYSGADVYDAFSRAEDAERNVLSFLRPHIEDRAVLDLGCGTGKYLELFAPLAAHITGLDAAAAQIALAQKRAVGFENVTLVCGDALDAALPRKSYDTVIGCWMLGTIADAGKRLAIIERFLSLLPSGGKMFLVENDENGAFEAIRGRANDPLKRTKSYNDWLTGAAGFSVASRFVSHFQFSNLQSAQDSFAAIWGEDRRNFVTLPCIEHAICIFSRERK